jgi:6-pyruvoyltetrahydropterin/6-carboxytetrahydropterin synthase
MFTIGVQSKFSSAHFHRGAEKSCEQIHGHNYRVEVQMRSPELRGDMVVDFGLVRQVLSEVIKPWDHHLLNEVEDFSGIEPTTEIICRLLYDKLSSRFSGAVSLSKVTVWETDDCWASYCPGE